MSYTIIAAIGKNRELGKNNDLIWHLPGDLKFFKETTTGHSIIMGRKTLESLPKLLPNRHHIVLSSSDDFGPEIEHYKSLKELLNGYEGAVYTIDARKISEETLGRYFPNTPMLAAIVKVTGIMKDEELLADMQKSFKHKFAKKPEVIEGNMKALEMALNEVKKIN